jgi:DNA/RNA endonuclease YhcR with UshA esterase domain
MTKAEQLARGAIEADEHEDRRELEKQLQEHIYKNSIVFDYIPGDRVKVKAIAEMGTVVQCACGTQGKDYQVTYWLNGEYKTVWFPASELESTDGA